MLIRLLIFFCRQLLYEIFMKLINYINFTHYNVMKYILYAVLNVKIFSGQRRMKFSPCRT